MNCRIAEREDYDLWALGLLEGPKREEISAHLQSGCPTCTRATRNCAALWFAIGSAEAQAHPAMPSAGLRDRILTEAGVQQPRSTRWLAFQWPAWIFAAMGAAAALVLAVWFLRPGPQAGRIEQQGREIARLQDEVRQWRERAEAAVRAPRVEAPAPAPPVTAPPPAAVPKSPTAVASGNPELTRELAEARQAAGTASDALAAERARAARLQTEIDSLRIQASAATAQKEEAEKRLSASATASDPRLAERERQIATMGAQLKRLEQENSLYRETIVRLERQVNRDSRLVALLNSPSVELVKLQGSEAGAKAQGKAFLVEGQRLVFYASNLPSLPPGRTYQLWLLRGRGPAIASGGVFGTDVSPTSPVEVSDRNLLSNLRGLAVTEEPAGGSPGPTGHKLLVGTVRAL